MVKQQLTNSESKLIQRDQEARDLQDLFCVIEKANKKLSKQLSLVSLNYYEAINEMEYSRHANNLQNVEKESISAMLKLLFDSNRNLSNLKIEGDKEES
jgi:DNA anti-recombination protein RmuC